MVSQTSVNRGGQAEHLPAAAEHLPQNGFSRTYGELEPACLVTSRLRTSGPTRWITKVGRMDAADTELGTWQGLKVSPVPEGPIE